MIIVCRFELNNIWSCFFNFSWNISLRSTPIKAHKKILLPLVSSWLGILSSLRPLSKIIHGNYKVNRPKKINYFKGHFLLVPLKYTQANDAHIWIFCKLCGMSIYLNLCQKQNFSIISNMKGTFPSPWIEKSLWQSQWRTNISK